MATIQPNISHYNLDTINEFRILNLHPDIIELAAKTIHECDLALTGNAKVRITQGLRTFGEQKVLFEQGRSKPGKIVTNAKAGESYHNFGIAVDTCLIIDNKEVSWDMVKDYDHDKLSDWKEVYNIFKANGWDAGADWHSFKDYPHYEKTFGFSVKQLLYKYNANDFIKGTTFVNLK
jgi:peptidoglycan L-alanyl-D-glutamate endopeptidase CwlK